MPRLTQLSRSIEGKVAVVTGAASGMGRATAHLLADEGAAVAVLDRSADALHAVADDIAGNGGRVAAIDVDLSDAAATDAAIAAARDALGPIDILINNAGVSLGGPDRPGRLRATCGPTTLAVNLTAYTRTIRAALEDLRRDGAGRIVNVASTEGLGATARISPYTASKHGVVGPHPGPGRGARAHGRHRQLHLPRTDPHRHDRAHPRGGQGEVRPAPRADAPLRRSGGGRPDHAVAGAPGGVVHHRRGDPGRRRPHRAEHMTVRIGFLGAGLIATYHGKSCTARAPTT